MKRLYSLILMVALALALVACGGDSDEAKDDGNADNKDKGAETPDTLVMGFVPSQDSGNIASTVEPLAERLSEELGIEVEGKVMVNYNALIEAMGAEQVQIGFIPAFGYVIANEQYDTEVILKSIRHGSGSYKAQYVVRSDSGIDSLEDLEGKIWAYADKGSTSGYLFPASQLMEKFDYENGPELESEFFGGSKPAGGHDTAALAVLDGEADVATTFDDVRDNLEEDYPEIKEDLKVIDYTDEIPNDTISVTKGLDSELVEKIKEVFLSFNDDEEMIKIMHDVYTWDAIEEATDEEYEVVRKTYKKFQDDISL